MYLQVPGCYQVDNIIANCLYSIHILFYFKIYNFFFKWHNLITYAGDGHYRFTDTLGISLTMPNKKYFFDFLPLRIFTGHNIEHFSEISPVWRHGNPFDSSGHTSLITSEHCKQKTFAQRYTSAISRQWLVVRMLLIGASYEHVRLPSVVGVEISN